MSNFYCPNCGKPIIENEDGRYATGCTHYPKEQLNGIIFKAEMKRLVKRVKDNAEVNHEN